MGLALWAQWPGSFQVIDGDTIGIALFGRPHVRLVGFDTPETYEPRCEAERELGERAKTRLTAIIREGDVELRYLACSCRPGTAGSSACNYGRDCGQLLSHGRDVGSMLIAEGLAQPYLCTARGCPRRPNPWC